MPEQLWFTEILNHLFAGPVTTLMRAVHVEPQFPQAPISNPVAMEILVVIFLLLLFLLVRTRLSVDEPKGLQHVFEGVHGFIEGQSEEIIGGLADTDRNGRSGGRRGDSVSGVEL